MHKQNIADFILYDMNKNHVRSGFGVDSRIISEVVEGWNRNIYITPNERIKFHHINKSGYNGLN
ncbi:MAG: hypothetical protein IJ532_06235 [Alphaproteobacteria bacterium]|nr:hypothetical protein [Alphaproteobacteria bacterium]